MEIVTEKILESMLKAREEDRAANAVRHAAADVRMARLERMMENMTLKIEQLLKENTYYADRNVLEVPQYGGRRQPNDGSDVVGDVSVAKASGGGERHAVIRIEELNFEKTEREKFAGALYTTSVEAFIPNTGRGIQGATSHCLGQNFAEMCKIMFDDKKGEKSKVWQNSWGYSTRTIRVMAMVHGDNIGLVVPPKVASVQVVVIPVPYKDADTEAIFDACTATVEALSQAGILAEADLSNDYTPAWKYSDWEIKGVPLRIEIGPKDLAKNQVRAVRRNNGVKEDISRDNLVEKVKDLLADIQQSLFDAAKQKRDACIQVVTTWELG